MNELVISIPTMVHPTTNSVRTHFLDLGLQSIDGVHTILYYAPAHALEVYDVAQEYGITEIVRHDKDSISEIRYFMREHCIERYPDRVNYQCDDDINNLLFGYIWDRVGNLLEVPRYETVRNPLVIYNYMMFLANKAKQEKALVFSPGITFKHAGKNRHQSNGERSALKEFSRNAVSQGMIGTLPEAPNMFPQDSRQTSMEETWHHLEIKEYLKENGEGFKPALRHNAVSIIAEADIEKELTAERKYCINNIVKRFGKAPVKYYHQALHSYIDGLT